MTKLTAQAAGTFAIAPTPFHEDGRMVHDMYLFEVKKPSESKARWDYYKLLTTIPGSEAFQPLEASRCPLVKK
jgi:branched-chain amino acid transport system substrate-binding protein